MSKKCKCAVAGGIYTYTYPFYQYLDQDIEYFHYTIKLLPRLYVLQCNYYSKFHITENNSRFPLVSAYSFTHYDIREIYPRIFRISKYCQTVFQSDCTYMHSLQREGTFYTSVAKFRITCLFSFHSLGGYRTISLWLNLHDPGGARFVCLPVFLWCPLLWNEFNCVCVIFLIFILCACVF